jgi:hypothetical protein
MVSDIFYPLRLAGQQRKPVSIMTWGLSHPSNMIELIAALHGCPNVALLVGYNKKTHDLRELLDNLKQYRALGWQVAMLPNMHIKLWIIGESGDHEKCAYAGSCNFANSDTIINEMFEVPLVFAQPVFDCYWSQAARLSYSTVLELIPQAKRRHDYGNPAKQNA